MTTRMRATQATVGRVVLAGRFSEGPELEGWNMPRSNDAEMALVQGPHLGLVQPLGESDDAGINDSERQVAVLVLQLATALQIGQRRGFDGIDAAIDVLEEDQPGVDGQALGTPIVELGQNQGRDDEILRCIGDQAGAALVVRIRRVQGRQQRPGV
jgi:hypothetical protein